MVYRKSLKRLHNTGFLLGTLWKLRGHTRIGGIDFIRKPFFVLKFTRKPTTRPNLGFNCFPNIIVSHFNCCLSREWKTISVQCLEGDFLGSKLGKVEINHNFWFLGSELGVDWEHFEFSSIFDVLPTSNPMDSLLEF